MAEVTTTSSAIFASDSGDFGESYPGYGWEVSTNDVASEVLGEVANDLKRIDVIISYMDDQFTFSLTTYRFLRE
jgi:hypothetical protein